MTMKKMGCLLVLSLLFSAPAWTGDLRADEPAPGAAAAPEAQKASEGPDLKAEAPEGDSNFQLVLVAQNGSQDGYSYSTWTYQSRPPADQIPPPKRPEAAGPALEAQPGTPPEEQKSRSRRRRPVPEEPKVTVFQLPESKAAPAGRTRTAEAGPGPRTSLVEMYHPELNAAKSAPAGPEAEARPERRSPAQSETPKTTLTYRRTNNVLPQRPTSAPAEIEAAPAPQEPARAREPGKAAQPPQAAAAPPAAATAAPVQPGLPPEQDLAQAYRVFDQKYLGSLGKNRKELKEWWGFPLARLGENENEVAYGFRQRGLINVPPPPPGKAKGKKSAQIRPTAYYASGDLMPESPDQRGFACLVVLWVDDRGKGVVVDGDAVGDCFSVEALTHKPVKFER